MKTLNEDILYKTIQPRPVNSYKSDYGKVVLIGGSHNYGGAIIMATLAAVNAGAGLVTTVSTLDNLTSLHSHCLEAMFIDISEVDQVIDTVKKADVIVIGPGLGTSDSSLELLNSVFKSVTTNQILVIDGSAITLIANHHLVLPNSINILTPHQMEWQRLSGIKIADQNTESNQAIAKSLNAIVIVKSHHSEIYYKDQVFKLDNGNPGQAIGGMGDTLAGIIGGFTAQFKNPLNATLAGTYIHSYIADQIAKDHYIVLPHQISELLPKYMHKFQNKKAVE